MAIHDAYTEEDDTLLKNIYPVKRRPEILAAFPNKSWSAIKHRASRLKLKRQRDIAFEECGRFKRDNLFQYMNEHDIAYLAGLLDGEGSVSFVRSKNKSGRFVYALNLHIANSSQNLKAWLKEKVPGCLYEKKTISPNKYGIKSNRPMYTWSLNGFRMCKTFLQRLMPYLVIKKPQAELVLTGYLHLSEEERDFMFHKARKLKHNN